MKGDKSLATELALLERVKATLEEGLPARSIEYTDDEMAVMKEISLISMKPVIYAANVAEDDFSKGIENNEFVNRVKELAAKEGSQVMPVSARIEEEISQLDGDEKAMFLEELNMSESGLDRLIKASYTLLGLISYLTAGEPEVRAWTITKGTKAPQAAGKIHTDFERGFIRAEVVHYDDLMECGSMTAAKEKGLVRSEGKDYVMKDGDIVLFRFMSFSPVISYCFVLSSFSLINFISFIPVILSFIPSILFSLSSTVTYTVLLSDTFFSRFSGVSIATIFPLFIIITLSHI